MILGKILQYSPPMNRINSFSTNISVYFISSYMYIFVIFLNLCLTNMTHYKVAGVFRASYICRYFAVAAGWNKTTIPMEQQADCWLFLTMAHGKLSTRIDVHINIRYFISVFDVDILFTVKKYIHMFNWRRESHQTASVCFFALL